MAKPFLKWVGGKRQLLPAIQARLPDMSKVDRYVEPFVGGGAVLFHLLEHHQFDEVHIFDLNPELILCYETIRDDVETVVSSLSDLTATYPRDDFEAQKPVFYGVRDLWNQGVGSIHGMTRTQRADRVAQMIFLNKTCFNGLYRVNRSGLFNTPIGRYSQPGFTSPEKLRAVSTALAGVQAHHGSFEACKPFVTSSTFAYFDPPYRPLSNTAAFTSYAKEDFNDDSQRALAAFTQDLDETIPSVRLMLSNSDPKNTDPNDEFFDDVYQGFAIARVEANRAINSDAAARGSITELLITNY
jgi:DNA adenine methylase